MNYALGAATRLSAECCFHARQLAPKAILSLRSKKRCLDLKLSLAERLGPQARTLKEFAMNETSFARIASLQKG